MLRTLSIIGLALLSACVTTAKITLTWVADDIHEKDLSGVLVVTTFAGKDQHEVLHPGRTYYGMQPRWLSWRLQAYMYRKFLDGTNTPVS